MRYTPGFWDSFTLSLYVQRSRNNLFFLRYFGLAVSTVLSILETERISKLSEFLTLWTISLCSFKYISHNYRGFEKHQNFWYFGLSVSAVLSIYLTYRGFQKWSLLIVLSIFEIERILKVSEFPIPWSLTTSFCSFMHISHIRGWKSVRISDTLDCQSAVLSIYFEIQRISKVSEFLILRNTSFCSFKYISHIRDLKSIRISDTLDCRSEILSIFDIEYQGFQKYQNFWYFGLPVCIFKHFWDRQDFKSIRISDTLEYLILWNTSFCSCKYISHIRISKVSEFLILWTTSFCSFKYISHIRDLKSIRISDTLNYQ